mmetsp:Transcript_17520/g.43427  ORF Transcript_17520/g.43427 Transcript_17520/m.43427 type:complete len:228 (+) Transcript_17520:1061-1744(+)
MRISLRFSLSALPAFKMNGTPSQRSLRMLSTTMANVGARDPSATPGQSRYPPCPRPAVYCPATTSCAGLTRATWRSTLSLASRMSSGSRLTGRSMASTAKICSRWFCSTSRIIPWLSKYPDWTPKGSLKIICTLLTFSRFQMGVSSRLANRMTSKLSMTSLPRYLSMRYRSRSVQLAARDWFNATAEGRSMPKGFSITKRVHPGSGLRPWRWMASAAAGYISCGSAR